MVAFEGNTIDQRVFHHMNHQCVALTIEPDILKEARRVKCLQRAIESVRVEGITRLNQHV